MRDPSFLPFVYWYYRFFDAEPSLYGGVGWGREQYLFVHVFNTLLNWIAYLLFGDFGNRNAALQVQSLQTCTYCRGSGTKQARKSEPPGTVWILIWSSYLWLGTSLPPSLLWCLPKPINSRLVSPGIIPPQLRQSWKGWASDGRRGTSGPYSDFLSYFQG